MPTQTGTVIITVWFQSLGMHTETEVGTWESLGLPAGRVTSERCLLCD